MDITFLGHASFKLRGKNAVVVTDPYDSSVGLKFPKVEADIVSVSHSHPDHNAVATVGGDSFVVSGPGEYEVKGVKIIGVSSFHDDKKGALRGKNTIYNFKIDGLYTCHLGDFGQTQLTSEQIEEIGQVDILLVPVGGVYTMDAETAAKVTGALEPKIVIPMHYQEEGLAVQLDGVEKFLKEMGSEKVEPQSKFPVTKEKLPEEPQVVLLEKV